MMQQYLIVELSLLIAQLQAATGKQVCAGAAALRLRRVIHRGADRAP
jgi:hypothetical protein